MAHRRADSSRRVELLDMTTWDVLRNKSTAPDGSTAIELMNSIEGGHIVFGLSSSMEDALLLANINTCHLKAEIDSGLQSVDMDIMSLTGDIGAAYG